MTFEDFTKKLAVIQSNDYLTIEETIDIKRHIDSRNLSNVLYLLFIKIK